MRIKLLILMILAAAVSAPAQKGLEIAGIFDGRYHDNPNAVETVITHNKMLNEYRLKVYHGLTVTGDSDAAEAISKAVAADGKSAEDRELVYKNGQPYYCSYVMPQKNGRNRYIFFLNQYATGGEKAMLIYLEGKADRETVKKLFK